MNKYPKVVIIGAGFGGLTVAQNLRKGPSEVRIIDKTNHHLFQPLLYQVASAVLAPNDIARPVREVLRGQRNAVVIMGEVVTIDKDNKEVLMANGDVYTYDILVVAPGARHSYFGNPQWEKYAPGLKDLTDALTIRDKILRSFEKAERSDSQIDAEKYLNFVVVGGGPTGVEVAGAVAEIAYQTLMQDFRRINPSKAKIYLIEGGDCLLGSFSETLSQQAKKDLEALGVIVRLNTMVTDVQKDRVLTHTEEIPCTNVVWAAGNEASPLLKSLETPLDRAGRAMVNPDLSIPDYPWVFVLGDAAHCKNKEEAPLPGVAPVAMQQGRYVAQLIQSTTPPELRKPFVYFDKGQMATIGRSRAVLEVGRIKLSGFLAWVGWGVVHIMFLISFRNKLRVMLEWFMSYMFGRRSSRLIHMELDSNQEPDPNTMSLVHKEE